LYWDDNLAKGMQIAVPETLVMDATKNLLIQNLMMREYYSIGAVVYHKAIYNMECGDALFALGLYGYGDEMKKGLRHLPGKENLQCGTILYQAADCYFLTRDESFLGERTKTYQSYCDLLAAVIEKDPHGLLGKHKSSDDTAQYGYWLWEESRCWRGMRSMAQAWKLVGRKDLYEKYRPIAEKHGASIRKAVDTSKKVLPDGSVFVPTSLLQKETIVYDSVRTTRNGAYWNLLMVWISCCNYIILYLSRYLYFR